MYTSYCPNCETSLELNVERCGGWTVCPKCKATLLVEYDYNIIDDDEYDYYWLEITNEEQNSEYYIENRIDT